MNKRLIFKQYSEVLIHQLLVLGVVIASFYAIFGFDCLDLTNIHWLHDDDQWQLYLSSLFFEDSNWASPIGLNPRYGLDISSSIAFNASGVAIIAKIFAGIFPKYSQILGVWLFLCFLLQAVLANKIIYQFSKNIKINLLAIALILFAPPLVMRASMHLSLVAHFLIIAAIYLVMAEQGARNKRFEAAWTFIMCISVSIHFYLFFMVGFIWLSNLVDRSYVKKIITNRQFIVLLIVNIAAVLIVTWEVGYFIVNFGSSTDFGFGLFRSHIFTFFDSDGWSYFIPKIPTSTLQHGDFLLSQGVYEGFGYLGSGFIFLIPFSIFGVYQHRRVVIIFFRRNLFFSISILLCSLFALSNNITFLRWNFHVPLNIYLFEFASVLRSSGRLIWPLYYCIIFILLYGVISAFTRKIALLILGIALSLQVLDTSSGWLYLRKAYAVHSGKAPDLILKNPFWNHVNKKYSKIYLLPLTPGPKQDNWKLWTFFSSRNSMATNAIYQSRMDVGKINAVNNSYTQQIESGNYDEDALYIVDDDFLIQVSKHLDGSKDLFARIDGFNVLAPDWFNCASCRQLDIGNQISKKLPPSTSSNIPILFGRNSLGSNYLIGVGQANQSGWGWAYPEIWGVWSEGYKSKLLLPFPSNARTNSIVLSLRALISPDYPYQTISISLNKKYVGTFELRMDSGNQIIINIPRDEIASYALLEFNHARAISPRDLKIGDDTRKLAIGLESALWK